MIEPANGPYSPGTCCKCQQTREFKNYVLSKDETDLQTKRSKTEFNKGNKGGRQVGGWGTREFRLD